MDVLDALVLPRERFAAGRAHRTAAARQIDGSSPPTVRHMGAVPLVSMVLGGACPGSPGRAAYFLKVLMILPLASEVYTTILRLPFS